jgi:indolepyruvate decarboxylase
MSDYSPTVASYLKTRLEQLGLDHIFGVAGNYTAAFLDTILADESSPIIISGNANEICAGYAADAYARIKGIGALYVTYSVGAFSLLNAIAGSFVEQGPVVLINGAPTNKEDSTEKQAGLLYSHTTGYQFVDIHMFRPVTAAKVCIACAVEMSDLTL